MAFNIAYTFEALDKFSAVSRKIANSLNKIEERVSLLRSKLKGAGNAISSFGKKMSVAITAPIVGIGIASLKSSDDLEKLKNRLSTLSGSAAEANKFYKQLIDFTVRSPFNLESIGNAAVTLRTMGFSADETFHSLKMLGNISAATGADVGMLAGMFGRARSSSRGVSLMFTTLGQYGVNLRQVLQDMAKATGHANVDIQKMVGEGKVSFADLLVSISKVADGSGQFSGQMNKLGGTIGALSGSFKTAIQSFILAPLGDTIDSVLNISGRLQNMINYLLENQKKITLFIKMHKDAIKASIIIAGIAAALGPVLIVLGLIVASVSTLISPWTIILSVVGVFIGLMLKAYLKHHSLANLLHDIVELYHKIVKSVTDFIQRHAALIEFAKTFLGVLLAIVAAAKVLSIVFGVIDLLLAPINLIPIAIAAAVAGAILLYKHFKWVRDVVKVIGLVLYGALVVPFKIIFSIVKKMAVILYDTFVAPFKLVAGLIGKIKGIFTKHAATIKVQKEDLARSNAQNMNVAMVPIKNQAQNVNSNLNINVRDPGNNIKNIFGESDGSMNANLGQNMYTSR